MAKSTLKPVELAALKATARTLPEDILADRIQKKDGRYIFRAMRRTKRSFAGRLDVDGTHDLFASPQFEFKEITLISPEDFEYTPKLTEADKKAAAPVVANLAKYKTYFAQDLGLLTPNAIIADAEAAGLPSVIDHRVRQSPVKDQGGRGTCVSHAVMGLLEAYAHIDDDLSEQYTHYKFNEFLGRPHNQDGGLKTTDAAPFLARNNGRVCLEREWPYIPQQATINAMVANGTYAPPQAAINNQRFGIGAYKIIEDTGLTGESIKNTRYLEALLFQGYNIVFGCYASWDDKDNNGVLDPMLTAQGSPVSTAGHAMLIVGYDRTKQYFIVKNSWDTTWGHNGYGYFSYNFFRACAKYGFVVDSVVPAEPPSPLPRKLFTAPFGVNKISRSSLRAAMVFFKTSSGRFAVAEVYAGDNLYLRNLRVYNADGSMHLERDSVIIRSSYLCDLDTARETTANADFWWEGVRPGVHFLVPRNGASACIAYDFASMTAANILAMNLTTTAVDSRILHYAVIAGKTTSGRLFKIVAHAKPGNILQLSYAEVFNADGSRHKYGQVINVPSSWTYDLDNLSLSGGTNADLWWHVLSSNVGFLERYSTAKIRLIWSL
ncbi:MAG: C1 family peptidase [Desulfobulbaceae bacterium]|nr:C1 family peptidase [Desulfobulbaceae bacterium]